MAGILAAVAVLTMLGLALGLLLSAASTAMAVQRDEKTEALREPLPGVNCGACGYSGCDGYAHAMAHGGAKVGLCLPGGTAVAKATAAVLGVDSGEVAKKTALVRCGGCEEYTKRKLTYHGLKSCAAANQFYGGDWTCLYGCLGYGDCKQICPYGAISLENGLARIDAAQCRGCGMCVNACPKALIALTPAMARGVVRCSNHDKGAAARQVCAIGCIGCMKCMKVCRYDAIHVQDALASIDAEKCIGCGACADSCPTGCIAIFDCP